MSRFFSTFARLCLLAIVVVSYGSTRTTLVAVGAHLEHSSNHSDDHDHDGEDDSFASCTQGCGCCNNWQCTGYHWAVACWGTGCLSHPGTNCFGVVLDSTVPDNRNS